MCSGPQRAEETSTQFSQLWASMVCRPLPSAMPVNTLAFATGTTYAWVVPMIPALQSKDPPVNIPPITDMEASWLASVSNLTRLFSIPACSYIIQRFGCKTTGIFIAVLYLVIWMMSFFVTSVNMLLWARLLSGVAFGGVLLLVPSYTIDIAEDNIKGRLGVLFVLIMSLGSISTYLMGFYTSFTAFHVSNILALIIFIAVFFWIPESPLYLAIEDKLEESKEALRWLRNGEDSEAEFERIKRRAQEVLEKRKQKISFRIITERSTGRGLLICMGLVINQQLCGIAPITYYALTIFQESGTTIPAEIATVLIGVLQAVGSLLSSLTTEKYGRRVLLIFSNVALTVCLFVLGIYLYLREVGWDLSVFGWLPFVCLGMYILSINVGVFPLPFTIATEMVSPQARNMVQGVCLATSALSTFFVLFAFTPTVKLVGQHGCFWMYALVCIVSAVCIFLVVPETKNRSIEDVVKQLKRDDYIRSVLRRDVTTPEDVKLQSRE